MGLVSSVEKMVTVWNVSKTILYLNKCVYIIYAKDSETNQFGVYACSPEDSSF